VPGRPLFDELKHPRDKHGRFTKSRTVKASAKDRASAKAIASAFTPSKDAEGAGGKAYLEKISGGQGQDLGGLPGVNTALRAGDENAPGVAGFDQATVALPDDVLLSRLVPGSAFGSTDPQALEGMKVRDAGFAPAQLGTIPATQGAVRMHMAVPAGTKAVVNPATGEVVLDRDTEMVVAKVQPNSAGGHDMYLTVLPKVGAKSDSKTSGPTPVKNVDKGGAPTGTPKPNGTAKATPDGTPTQHAKAVNADVPPGGDQVRADLMKLKVADLQSQMRERGLKPARLRKSQLVDALVADEMGHDNTAGGKPTPTVPAKNDIPPARQPDTTPNAPSTPVDSQSVSPQERSKTAAADMLDLINAGVSRSTIASAMRDLLAEHNLNGDETPELKNFVDLVNSPEAQIRAVVQDLLAERGLKVGIGKYVTLEKVRNRLPSALDRATVDHALKMLGRADAALVPESNQKTLTREQRAAAVHLGGQDKHVIALNGTDRAKLAEAARAAAGSVAEPAKKTEPGKTNTPSGKASTGSKALSAAPVGLHRGDGSLTAEQTAGLTEYQDGSKPGFKGINATLRGTRTSDDKTSAAVAGIDSAMASSALTQDVETWRGIRSASTMFGPDRMSGDLTGLQWREDAFVSTSPDPGGVSGFAGTSNDPMRMRIVAPAGTAAIDMSDPADPSEVELLLDRGHTFEIVADHGLADGVRQVDVVVQPKPAG
jgi:hypothetical protein